MTTSLPSPLALLRRSDGFAMLAVVVLSAVLLVSTVAAIRLSRTDLRSSANLAAHTSAFYAAEAGVQQALARLERDRGATPPSTGGGYAPDLLQGALGNGATWEVSIGSDPDDARPGRKQILSTGRFADQSSRIDVRALVQDPPAISGDPDALCPLLFSNQGTAQFVSNVAVANARLFDGEIFSNHDVKMTINVGASFDAGGLVQAGRDFVSNDLLAIGASLDAELEYGRAYERTALDLDGFGVELPVLGPLVDFVLGLAGPPLDYLVNDLIIGTSTNTLCTVDKSFVGTTLQELLSSSIGSLLTGTACALVGGGSGLCSIELSLCPGIYFSNGEQNLGEQVAPPPARPFPEADFDSLRHDPRTILVTEDSVPFGSWDAATDTWVFDGILAFPTSPEVIYFVEGNARLGTITLAEESTAMIVATGNLGLQTLNLLNLPLSTLVSPILATLPGILSPVVDIVDGVVGGLSSRGQSLWLLARGDVVVGRPVLSEHLDLVTALGLDSVLGLTSFGVAVADIGLPVLAMPVETNLLAYSATGNVLATVSTVGLGRDSNVCLIADQDAVLSAGTVNVSSAVRSIPVTSLPVAAPVAWPG